MNADAPLVWRVPIRSPVVMSCVARRQGACVAYGLLPEVGRGHPGLLTSPLKCAERVRRG